MVRYARAKGSKASNERRFEEATSWSEMRQQLTEVQRRAQSKVNKVIHKVDISNDNENEPVETSWAHFDLPCLETQVKQFPDTSMGNDEKVKRKKDKQILDNSAQHHSIGDLKPKKKKIKHNSMVRKEETSTEENEGMSKQKVKQNVKEQIVDSSDYSHSPEKFIKNEDVSQKERKKGKIELTKEENVVIKKKKRNADSSYQSYSPEKNITNKNKDVRQKKRMKDMIDLEFTNEENAIVEEYDKTTIKEKTKNKLKKKEKQFISEDVSNWPQTGVEIDSRGSTEEVGNDKMKDNRELMCDRINDGKRKLTRLEKEKAGSQSTLRKDSISPTLNIAGRVVEIGVFDGFAVLKEDWERLDALKKKMVEQGVPQHEIRAQLRVLRRRAEKSLARMKKKVCLRCRQPGHLLADCPSNSNDLIEPVSSNICFKCGSTEHSYLTCKVVKSESFRYASCFVCGEQGHIARQCPDNPRGVYPTGGACKICGDVTHLKKDCPEYQEMQHQSTVTLHTLSNNTALEGLETDLIKKTPLLQKSKKKVVKF